ncbi:MAG: tripartite tricarboxylate transporter substrate binding protein [Betaproteobacteria bacterium]|nr:tripartite tricarboxylate transporter substrate binding protein [Betaproteobacteria bacterium]
MTDTYRLHRLHLLVALVAAAAPAAAAGAAYPDKPIRLVVPFPPGGGADTLARVVAHKLNEKYGQQIVVDNRGGAGGLVGTETVARASPDGYTLLMGTASTHGSNPSLYEKLPYDPVKNFAPVVLLASVPNILVVHPSVAAKSVKDLIALAKQKPGAINYASVGVGSSQHLIAEMFKRQAGVDLVHVPYKGTGPALNDLISGQVQMMFTNLITAVPHVKSGRLRGLAVTSARRSVTMPELPAVAEVLPGFDVSSWYGLLAPAGTPRPVIDALNREVIALLQGSDVRERLAVDGAEPGGGTPEQFAAYIRNEIAKYAATVKAANIRPE